MQGQHQCPAAGWAAAGSSAEVRLPLGQSLAESCVGLRSHSGNKTLRLQGRLPWHIAVLRSEAWEALAWLSLQVWMCRPD